VPGILLPPKITVKGAPCGRVAEEMGASAHPCAVILFGKTIGTYRKDGGGVGAVAVQPTSEEPGEGRARRARGEPPDSAATAAEPALQILGGNAMLDAPCLNLRDINRIGQSPRRLVGKV
jgi:hypothetical protein